MQEMPVVLEDEYHKKQTDRFFSPLRSGSDVVHKIFKYSYNHTDEERRKVNFRHLILDSGRMRRTQSSIPSQLMSIRRLSLLGPGTSPKKLALTRLSTKPRTLSSASRTHSNFKASCPTFPQDSTSNTLLEPRTTIQRADYCLLSEQALSLASLLNLTSCLLSTARPTSRRRLPL